MDLMEYTSLLDFDETSRFLSALLKTVPSLEQVPEWDEMELPNDAVDTVPFYSPSFEVSTEDTRNNMGLFGKNPLSSTRLGSYSELLDLNFVASLEQSPNTTFLSPHTLPQDLLGKDPSAFQFSQLEFQPSAFDEGLDSSKEAVKVSVKTEPIANFPYDETAESDVSIKKESPNIHVKRCHDEDEPENDVKAEKKVRTSHRIVERNYRCNINSKINELRDAVPTLRIATGGTNLLIADLEGLVPASKLNKASILSKAIEYIEHVQKKNDTLQSKIERLQMLVGNASAASNQQSNTQMQQSASLKSQLDFLFDFSENNLPLIYDNDISAPANAALAYPMSNSRSRASNMFLGGLAVAMGSSFINDDSFRGLGAIPVGGLFQNSQIASQLIHTLRLVVLASGFVMIFEPLRQMIFSKKDKKSTSSHPLFLSWLLVSCGLLLPPPLAPEERNVICERLLGKRRTTFSQTLKDYALLSSSEVTFENCVLTVLTGSLLIKKSPSLSTVISMALKRRGSLLRNLEYSGSSDGLKQLAAMIKTLDGLHLFESDNLMQRFVNLSLQVPICTGINSGENEMTYVDFYLRNRSDLYGVLYSWRVVELIHELNVVYLEILSTSADDKNDGMKSLEEDLDKLEKYIGNNNPLKRQLLLLKGVISSKNVPNLMATIQADLRSYMDKLNAMYVEAEVTDDDSEFEEESESRSTVVMEGPNTLSYDIINNRSILYSLNIIDEEKFIALVSSAVMYYLKDDKNLDALKLLRLLEFKEASQPVTLFTITCFVKLVCAIIKSENEDKAQAESEEDKNLENLDPESCKVLESLIKLMRGWLNDNTKDCLTQQLRSDLSDLVVNKGLALNAI